MSRQSEKIQATGDTSGVHLWLVLWRAYDAVSKRALASIASLGLGLSDFAVLEVLLHKGPLPVNTIGPKVRLTSGSISVAVDRLVERGLVERRAGAKDRRERIVHLTAEGKQLIECAFGRHAAMMDTIATDLTGSERQELARMLKLVGRAAEAGEAPGMEPGANTD